MPKCDIWLDYWVVNEHACEYMKRYGIDYKDAVPFTTLDGWRFYDCTNIPDPLPEGLSIQEHKGFLSD